MPDWSFHPTLIEPFYSVFMNGNILRSSHEEQRRILADFHRRLPEYSDAMLREMLYQSWRSQKVAAWVIAQRRQHTFLSVVIQLLLRFTPHPEHLCICLARLAGNEASEALEQYLERCFETSPMQLEWEALRVDVAFAALCWLKPEDEEAYRDALDRYCENIDFLHPHWQIGSRLRHSLPDVRKRFLAVMALLDSHL